VLEALDEPCEAADDHRRPFDRSEAENNVSPAPDQLSCFSARSGLVRENAESEEQSERAKKQRREARSLVEVALAPAAGGRRR